MSSSLDHKCQRCGSQYHGQICPFCTITGLDVNALLASEGLSMPAGATDDGDSPPTDGAEPGEIALIDVVSNRAFPITSPVCRFGRDISNDIVLTGDKSLSRFHFQVTIVNNEYFVEDAGSRNGSFLNGAPVTAPKKIQNGDIVSAGMSRYRFVMGGDTAAAIQAQSPEAAATAAEAAASVEPDDDDMPMEAPADPLMRIMQEGQALLGSDSTEDSSDLEPFFNKEKEGNGSSAGGNAFMQLDSAKDTPIDELFQQQIRAAAAAKEQAATESAACETATKESSAPDYASAEPKPELNGEPQTHFAPTHAGNNRHETKKGHSERHDWPAWCTNYTFPEVIDIKSRMEKLELEIREKQQQLNELSATVESAEDIRNRVLATRDCELVEACSEIFRLLGFETALNGASENEVILHADGGAAAIAKVVCTDAQPRPADLANLVSSLSTYWCDNGVEPKGILVVSMMSDGMPEDRAAFTKDIADYAAKKNVCLMNTVQLLAMYRDATLRSANVESIRSEVLGATGLLIGFEPVTSRT